MCIKVERKRSESQEVEENSYFVTKLLWSPRWEEAEPQQIDDWQLPQGSDQNSVIVRWGGAIPAAAVVAGDGGDAGVAAGFGPELNVAVGGAWACHCRLSRVDVVVVVAEEGPVHVWIRMELRSHPPREFSIPSVASCKTVKIMWNLNQLLPSAQSEA